MREALDCGGRPELVLGYFVEQIGPDASARLRAALRRPSKRVKK